MRGGFGLITDSQLKTLFAKANNIQIATTSGGKARQKIWFTLNGQKIQGTCIRDIPNGEAIALLTDDGEWYLSNITDRPREQATSRNLEFRKIQTPDLKNIKFLVWSQISNDSLPDKTYIKASVNLFLGINELIPKNKNINKYYSEANDLPDIQSLKLIYIPIIRRRLSIDEISRLVSFSKKGGTILIAADGNFFDPSKEYTDEILIALDSPLRASTNINTIVGDSGVVVDAQFPRIPRITKLTIYTTSDVIGGTVISFVNNSPWIAYDKNSKTILSGDADAFLKPAIDSFEKQNGIFARSLLKRRI